MAGMSRQCRAGPRAQVRSGVVRDAIRDARDEQRGDREIRARARVDALRLEFGIPLAEGKQFAPAHIELMDRIRALFAAAPVAA